MKGTVAIRLLFVLGLCAASAARASGVRMCTGSAVSWSRNSRSGQNRCESPPDASTTTRRSSERTASASNAPNSNQSSGVPVWQMPVLTHASSPWRKPSRFTVG